MGSKGLLTTQPHLREEDRGRCLPTTLRIFLLLFLIMRRRTRMAAVVGTGGSSNHEAPADDRLATSS